MASTIKEKPVATFLLANSFLRQFLLKPFEVGAVVPSSRWLAAAVLDDLPETTAKSVIEYGPGTGSFTAIIFSRLGLETQFIAVEPNEFFADQIQEKFSRVIVVRDYAENIGFYLGDNRGKVDFVISGLPFSLMDWQVVEKTVLETSEIIKPGGHFRTFVYCHMNYYWKIRKLRTLLSSCFGEVSYTTVVRNAPPAIVIKCRK